MRAASESQSTVAGTSPTDWRSSAASCSSRGGSPGAKGLNVPSSRIESSLRIVVTQEASEYAAKLPARLVKVPPHRAWRELHQLADLRARHPIDVEQRHDQPLTLGQRSERVLEDATHVAPLALLERGGRLAHTLRLRLGAPACARSPKVGAAVDDDAHQPRTERASHLERIEVLVRGEEGLLHQILGVLAMPDDAKGDAERLLHVRSHQRVERGGVTGAGTGDECAIALRCGQSLGRRGRLGRNVRAHGERDARTCAPFSPAARGLSHPESLPGAGQRSPSAAADPRAPSWRGLRRASARSSRAWPRDRAAPGGAPPSPARAPWRTSA